MIEGHALVTCGVCACKKYYARLRPERALQTPQTKLVSLSCGSVRRLRHVRPRTPRLLGSRVSALGIRLGRSAQRVNPQDHPAINMIRFHVVPLADIRFFHTEAVRNP